MIYKYKRKKVRSGKNVSELDAKSEILRQIGATVYQVVDTEHTDLYWVFVIDKAERGLHRVSAWKTR